MSQFKDQVLLVTGASGHFGRIAVEELLRRGATRVIAGTRDPGKLAELEGKGVEVRRVDFDDAASLEQAFVGVDRLLMISTDGIGKRIAQQTAAVAAAKTEGVKHIVYTSAPAARPNAESGVLIGEHFWTEQAIAQSGMDFTVLRIHMYAENNLANAANVINAGQMFGLVGDRGTAYVTRADAARTAAGALLSAQGKTIEDVTGPAPVTNSELAGLLAKLGGKPVTSVALAPAELLAGMVAAGLPKDFAQVLVAVQTDAVLGYHGVVTDIVQRYSGRKPQSLAEFLAEHQSTLTA